MTLKTRAQIQNNLSATNGVGNTKKFLTIHQTDNFAVGASAAAHANLQSRGYQAASWHWQVDDKEAVQSYMESVKCWHAGDGGQGNRESIAVEFCVNRDGNYAKAFDNAAQLAAQILKRNKIPLSRMVQHNYWSGKNCPSVIRRDGDWTRFRNLVQKYLTGETPVPSVKPKAKIDPDGYWGRDTTLKAQEVFKTAIDGEVSSQASIWRQKYGARLTGGWEWVSHPVGSKLIMAIQKFLKAEGQKITKIDGLIGPEFIAAFIGHYAKGKTLAKAIVAFQKRLNKGKK